MNSTRVFRFIDSTTGALQVSDFPETPPSLDDLPPAFVAALSPSLRDLLIRIRHFTEIENLAFLGYKLAREIDEERLGDEVLSKGIDWEHTVAATNDRLVPGDPLRMNDAAFQAIIDDFDEQTEVLVEKINLLSRERAKRSFKKQQEDVQQG